MTIYDYLNESICKIVDEIEDKVEEKGWYKVGALEFIKLELEQRIDRYIKRGINEK